MHEKVKKQMSLERRPGFWVISEKVNDTGEKNFFMKIYNNL